MCHYSICMRTVTDFKNFWSISSFIEPPGNHQIRVGPKAHILYVFQQLPCGAANVKSSQYVWDNGIIGFGNSTTVGSFVRVDQGL